MKKTFPAILFLFLMLFCHACKDKHNSVTWQEENGILRIEAENGEFGSDKFGWEIGSDFPGHSGSGYVIWRGASNWGPESKPYDSISLMDRISYRIKIETPGKYYVKVLNYHLKEDGDNDVWASVDKSDWGKTYDWQVEKWTLDERGEWAKYDLAAGLHDIELAGRSPGFAIDQIVIFEESLKSQFIPEAAASDKP